MPEIDLQALLQAAKTAARNAYAPYSGYKVGSALLCADGSVFTGCNVENASYSLTICAERAAIFAAINSGHQSFLAIAIYVDSDKSFPPCGACRQVISEFAHAIPVIFANQTGAETTSMAELLPGAFKLR